MKEAEILKKMKQIRALVQYKKLDEDELREKAIALIKEKGEKLDWNGLTSPEEKKANKIFAHYLENHDLDNFSDRIRLQQLVWFEIITERSQKQLGDASSEKIPILDSKQLGSLQSLIADQAKLRKELGISDDKISDTGVTFINKLFEKMRKWMLNNQLSRVLKCPHCSKIIMLRMRTKYWEAQKHPFFSDRFFGNPAIIKFFKAKKITKEECAEILEVSPDYIDFLTDKWQEHPTWEKLPNADKPNSIKKTESHREDS